MLFKISFNFHLVSEPLTSALFKKKIMISGHDFSSFWFKKSFLLMLIQFSATGFHYEGGYVSYFLINGNDF